MTTRTITSRFDGRTLYECEAESLLKALRTAVRSGADLCGADLRGAYLRGAYLCGADLSGADLRGAYLRGAYLGSADLGGADLRGADLRGAYLGGADLGGAKMNWQSRDILGEILRRAAGLDIGKRKVAGLVLISRDWCWSRFATLESDPLFDWALDTLAEYVQDGDDAPDIVRQRVNATGEAE